MYPERRQEESTRSTGAASAARGRWRIWILVSALSVGGTERTVVDLVNNLDREAYDVTLWTVFDRNPLAGELADDVTLRTLGVRGETGADCSAIERASNPVDYLRAPLRFGWAVHRESPDIVHSFLYFDNLVARFVGLVAPDTAIITGERGFHSSSRRILRFVDRLTARLSDAAVSNSPSGARYLADSGLPEEAVEMVPNGRRLDAYRTADGSDVRAELGLPPDVTVIGTVGRLIERKGHLDLLEAWRELDGFRESARLLVVGGGPESDRLDAYVREHGLSDSTILLGEREDVPELLDLMDVFVFPSHWEGLPGALLEAMAAGLPIVATDVDGNADLVVDDESGLLVPPKAPSSLAAALERLLEDPEYAAELGEAAQDRVYRRFGLDSMVEGFEEVYDAHL